MQSKTRGIMKNTLLVDVWTRGIWFPPRPYSEWNPRVILTVCSVGLSTLAEGIWFSPVCFTVFDNINNSSLTNKCKHELRNGWKTDDVCMNDRDLSNEWWITIKLYGYHKLHHFHRVQATVSIGVKSLVKCIRISRAISAHLSWYQTLTAISSCLTLLLLRLLAWMSTSLTSSFTSSRHLL